MSTETEPNLERLEQKTKQERNYFYQLLGRLQMADAFHKMAQIISLKEVADIKENKLYRNIKGEILPDGAILGGTWTDFCLYKLGQSREKIDADLANYRAFGEEALEAMQAAGIGFNQFRDLRRLPENVRRALIEAAKSESKDDILDTAEVLLNRAHAEKEKLQSSLTEADANLKAKEQLLADRNKELIDAKDKLVLIQDVREHENKLRSEIAAKAVEAQSVVTMRLGEGFRLLAETIPESEDEETARERRHFMAEHIKIVKDALEQLQDEYGLPDDPMDLEDIPDYAQDDDPEAQAKIAPPADYKTDEHGRWIAPDQTGE